MIEPEYDTISTRSYMWDLCEEASVSGLGLDLTDVDFLSGGAADTFVNEVEEREFPFVCRGSTYKMIKVLGGRS